MLWLWCYVKYVYMALWLQEPGNGDIPGNEVGTISGLHARGTIPKFQTVYQSLCSCSWISLRIYANTFQDYSNHKHLNKSGPRVPRMSVSLAPVEWMQVRRIVDWISVFFDVIGGSRRVAWSSHGLHFVIAKTLSSLNLKSVSFLFLTWMIIYKRNTYIPVYM